MRDFFLLLVALAYLVGGFQAPFIFGLAYIWTDYFNPQRVAFSFMRGVPLSLLMGLLAALAFLVSRKPRTKIVLEMWLLVCWALWVTLTTTWAEVPVHAWETWDWSFKTVCFAAFLPFLFKSRVQLEAMLLTIAFGVGASIIAFAAKTLITGGHYGASFSLIGGNSGLGEEGTLACVSVALIPILRHYRSNSLIVVNRTMAFIVFDGLSVAAVVAAVGSFERTGLVALGACTLLYWWNSRKKLLTAAILIGAISVSGYILSDRWLARMNTIQTAESDVSAMTRLTVWAWDLEYVASHPLGGGFNVYEINHIFVPVKLSPSGVPQIVEETARAPHSIYFQVLSEHGIPGALIFAALLANFFLDVRRVRKTARARDDSEWADSLARSISASGIIYLCGGAFQGIAFQPFLYDLIASGVILAGIVRNSSTAPAVARNSGLRVAAA